MRFFNPKWLFRIFKSVIFFVSVLSMASCRPLSPETALPSSSPAITSTASPSATITPEMPTPTAVPTVTEESTPTEVYSPTITLENAAELSFKGRLGQGTVLGPPAYSPDGMWLAVPTSIGVNLYNGQTLEFSNLIPITDWQGMVAFSPDNQFMVTDKRDGLQVWNPADGSLLKELAGIQGSLLPGLTISPDSQWIAASLDDGMISVWQLASGESYYSIRGRWPAFSPDSKLLVAAVRPKDGEIDQLDHVQVYQSADGTPVSRWDGQRGFFSPDGSLLVENNGAARLIDLSTKQVLRAFNGSIAALSADGKLLAALDRGIVRLYQTSEGTRIRDLEGEYVQVLEGQYANTAGLRFAPDGNTLAGSLGYCPECAYVQWISVIWRISDGKLVQRFSGDAYLPWLAYSADGKMFLAAGSDAVRIFNTVDGSEEKALTGYSDPLAGMAFSPDGNALATASGFYHSVHIWDLSNDQIIQSMRDPGGGGSYDDMPVVYSPDGQILAVRGNLWRLIDGTRLTQLEQAMLKEHSFWASSVAFSPDGKTLAAGFMEGQLQMWDLENVRLLRKLDGYSGDVIRLAYSPDGQKLAAVLTYPDFIVQVWHASDGKRLFTLKDSYFEQVIYSPDGRILGTLADQNQNNWPEFIPTGKVQFWDAESGTSLLTLPGEDDTSLAFTPDGQIVATGSYGGDVQLWQVSNGQLLKTLKGHSGPVKDVAFSPDGRLLASSSEDGTVLLWSFQGK